MTTETAVGLNEDTHNLSLYDRHSTNSFVHRGSNIQNAFNGYVLCAGDCMGYPASLGIIFTIASTAASTDGSIPCSINACVICP